MTAQTKSATEELSRLESALRDSEERFRSTFEQAAVGLAHVTPDGRWLRVNHRLTEILGYSRDELVERSIAVLTHPDDTLREEPLLEQLLAGEIPWFSIEKRYIRKDGTMVWVDRTVSLVSDASGNAKYLISVVQDATDRRWAQQRALAQSAVSRALIESSDEAKAIPEVLRVIGELLGWRVGAFWKVDPQTQEMRRAAAWDDGSSLSAEFVKRSGEMSFARGAGLPGRVWATGTPLWVTDFANDHSFPRADLAHDADLHGAFGFPIRGPRETLGVMEFFSRELRSPDEHLLATIGGLGNQVGQFLERRRIEGAARTSEARNAAIVRSALDAVVTIDHKGIIREFNPAAEVTFGYTRDQALGKSMGELIVPPRLREAHRKGMERFLREGNPHVIGKRIEIAGMRADQTEFPLELAITQMPVDGPPMFTGYMRDLTKQKQAEATRSFLLEASEVLASSLDYSTTLASVARLAVPRIADWAAIDMVAHNGSIERLAVMHTDPAKLALVQELESRYPSDPNSSTGVPQVIRTGVAEHMANIPDELLVGAAKDEQHLALIRQLGLRSYIAVPLIARSEVLGVITLVMAESGRRFDDDDLALARDLARRAAMAIENARLYHQTLESQMRMEDQAVEMEVQARELERAKDDLENANADLLAKNEELMLRTQEAQVARALADEANKAKSAFLATMSHELRTPLNAIGGYAQLLEDGIRGPTTPEQRDDLRRIRKSQQHLTGLVNDVLNFAKLDIGRVQLRLEEIPVNEALAGVDFLIRPQVREKKLTYAFTPRAVETSVIADRERMLQIVTNLLSNAIKFTAPGGHIYVDWDVVDEMIEIRVRDTGRGIPADKLDEIFKPFLQLDRKLTREAEGVGLGLAISRDLARAMRGDLAAESVLGEGSTFRLRLPMSGRKVTPWRSMEAVPGQKSG